MSTYINVSSNTVRLFSQRIWSLCLHKGVKNLQNCELARSELSFVRWPLCLKPC